MRRFLRLIPSIYWPPSRALCSVEDDSLVGSFVGRSVHCIYAGRQAGMFSLFARGFLVEREYNHVLCTELQYSLLSRDSLCYSTE